MPYADKAGNRASDINNEWRDDSAWVDSWLRIPRRANPGESEALPYVAGEEVTPVEIIDSSIVWGTGEMLDHQPDQVLPE